MTDHGAFILVNVYVPNAATVERLQFKLRFLRVLQARTEALISSGRHVIIVGDLNIAAARIDHCDPDVGLRDLRIMLGQMDVTFETHPQRLWFNEFVRNPAVRDSSTIEHEHLQNSCMFADIYRERYPTQTGAYTCWNMKTFARQTNYGTRIDYVLTDCGFVDSVQTIEIVQNFQGSDHCPVAANISYELPAGSHELPPLCAKMLPEFSARQSSLKGFLVRNNSKQQDAADNMNTATTTTTTALTVCTSDSSRSSFSTRRSKTSTAKQITATTTPAGQLSLKSFFSGTPATVAPTTAISTSVRSSPIPTAEQDIGILGTNQSQDSHSQIQAWKGLLGGRGAAPLCTGHQEPCVLRVAQTQENKGRSFWYQ